MRNPAFETIKQVGIFGLCATDGCYCMRFSVHHVDVSISCRKSGGSRVEGGTTVLVTSPSLEYCEEISPDGPVLLREVGEEVARQLRESDSFYPVGVFYEDANSTSKGSSE